MVSEHFCPSCMRTVYSGDAEAGCPVCSTPLLNTGHRVPQRTKPPRLHLDRGLRPANEDARLDAINRYEILDTPRDGAFDRITSLAAKIFDVPIATVTIVDTDRIWFKSAHGIEAEQIGRDPGLCASAILTDDVTVINDARLDPHALSNPLVLGELGLRFYAGAPLRTADGFNLGTLNIIDDQPRTLTSNEETILSDLAQIVIDELELRLAARRLYKELGVPTG